MAHGREDRAAQQAVARLFALAFGDSAESARKLLIDRFGPAHRVLEAGTLECSQEDLRRALEVADPEAYWFKALYSVSD
jgi:hypothetical protein